MLSYDPPLYRPPSEAQSLIFQVTLGCSHNACQFCTMYKSKTFRLRPLQEILQEIQKIAPYAPQTLRVFLADGDALVLKTQDLLLILKTLKQSFPLLRRVSLYANAKNILCKSLEDLSLLKQEGLSLIYLGLESGSPHVLKNMNKGSTPKQNIEAILKAKATGLKTSVMVISGLGGQNLTQEHALLSAQAISQMNPDFFSLLTLYIENHSPLKDKIKTKEFIPLTPLQILEETKLMIQNIQGKSIVFRSNHASNYLNLAGVLSRDKEILLQEIKKALNQNNTKAEFFRGL